MLFRSIFRAVPEAFRISLTDALKLYGRLNYSHGSEMREAFDLLMMAAQWPDTFRREHLPATPTGLIALATLRQLRKTRLVAAFEDYCADCFESLKKA